MGWNQGYSIFEETVIGAYDLGVLDRDLLAVIMEPYRGTDIDCGGEMGLTAKDGLGVVDVVLKVWGVELPAKPDLPDDHREWTREQDRAFDEYREAQWEAFRAVTKGFGW
jgi:hypothetical protein